MVEELLKTHDIDINSKDNNGWTARAAEKRYEVIMGKLLKPNGIDGHESHRAAELDNYCEANKIIPLCLPPQSSHLTQPLDVGFFGPLKHAYGDEINKFSRASINHITKNDFLVAFQAEYFKANTAKQYQRRLPRSRFNTS